MRKIILDLFLYPDLNPNKISLPREVELVLLACVDCIVLIYGEESVEALINCPDGLGCLVL